ncbi:transglutaminase domain-containing protein [Maribacter chungangensis]|uniref:Transglutaminase domain-containing protein n=1 Tax=Maribacter chungangensis TaxID=1069117 RepID=A0ABW3B1A5_9FLAO
MKWIGILLFCTSSLSLAQRSDFRHIDFTKADSIAYEHQNESLENLPILTHNLTAHLATDVEKFRAIYTWVGISIENDYSSYLTTKKKRKKLSDKPTALREWNNSFTPKVFENLVKHKKTACTGYAYLIRELAALAGIKSKIVDGYGRTATLLLDGNSIPNHSWNTVLLNGKWYLCDATWSAGKIILDADGPRFEQDYFDGYFLASPELFIKNHYPLDIKSSLLDQPPTFEAFLKGPVVYKAAFRANIIPKAPQEMQLTIVKNEDISFRFSSEEAIEIADLSLVLNKGGTSRNVLPKIIEDGKEYVLTHNFSTPISYDAHVKLGDDFIASYVVRVKRK